VQWAARHRACVKDSIQLIIEPLQFLIRTILAVDGPEDNFDTGQDRAFQPIMWITHGEGIPEEESCLDN